uniref:Uncharacterized protein n=1 Tax=Arundo donax TaxID=35708 RepID=A0A0A8YFH3_ARUDO
MMSLTEPVFTVHFQETASDCNFSKCTFLDIQISIDLEHCSKDTCILQAERCNEVPTELSNLKVQGIYFSHKMFPQFLSP